MSLINSILNGGKAKEDKPNDDSRKFQGKILKLYKKGYGFLSTPELEFTRVFFHWSVLTRDSPKFPDLAPNMPVEFSAREFDEKGWRAIMVKVDVNSTKGKG